MNLYVFFLNMCTVSFALSDYVANPDPGFNPCKVLILTLILLIAVKRLFLRDAACSLFTGYLLHPNQSP